MGKTDNEPQLGEGGREASAELAALNREIRKIVQWLKKVRFRRALFGVSEKDVWKKIGELNEMYMTAVAAERARCDALLEQMRGQYEEALRSSHGQGEQRE